jgi:hypothetical protein
VKKGEGKMARAAKTILFLIAAIVLALTARICLGEEVKVLPEDGGKWYISVIGQTGEKQYEEVLGWFDSGDLKDLKDQVHFNAVPTDSPMFEHYQAERASLPVVRVQAADGEVVYEAAGKQLPWSRDSLYGAIANSAGEFLRRHHRERDQKPVQPDPKPILKPILDPPPVPLNNGGAPILRPRPLLGCLGNFIGSLLEVAGVILCVVAMLIGFGISRWEKKRG